MKDTAQLMQQQFHRQAEHIIRAPGRVNLIGEHTDYNGGFVLPCAINFAAEIAIAKRSDNTVRLLAADYDGQTDEFPLAAAIPHHPNDGWANYARGVIQTVQQHSGAFPHGFDLVISGNIPQGAGLSSSAAYEVALASALNTLFQLNLDKKTIALLGQQAENQYVGCNCGIMDQLISAVGEKDHALLIDCRSLDTRAAAMNPDWAVVIINSNVKRGLVDSKYNERRQQCETAAGILGVPLLRGASLEQLDAAKAQMSEIVYRRARHVISDSGRAIAMADALAQGDLTAIHRLMADSHRSMRDDFEITHPHVDTLVNIVADVIGNDGGVRMTGGGFGGCIVCLTPHHNVERIRSAVLQQYPEKTGLQPDIFICTACEGVHEVTA